MDKNEQIQVAAYYLWQKSGSPAGRSEEFWFKATEELEKSNKQPECCQKTVGRKRKVCCSKKTV